MKPFALIVDLVAIGAGCGKSAEELRKAANAEAKAEALREYTVELRALERLQN